MELTKYLNTLYPSNLDYYFIKEEGKFTFLGINI